MINIFYIFLDLEDLDSRNYFSHDLIRTTAHLGDISIPGISPEITRSAHCLKNPETIISPDFQLVMNSKFHKDLNSEWTAKLYVDERTLRKPVPADNGVICTPDTGQMAGFHQRGICMKISPWA